MLDTVLEVSEKETTDDSLNDVRENHVKGEGTESLSGGGVFHEYRIWCKCNVDYEMEGPVSRQNTQWNIGTHEPDNLRALEIVCPALKNL